MRMALFMSMLIGTATAASASPWGAVAGPLRAVGEKRIFFGHQSVGANILDGLRDLAREHGTTLAIREANGTGDGPAIVDARVGENTRPRTKIQAFARMMDEGWAARSDVAFFKFCYVDIDAETDVQALFDEYVRTLADLKRRHPGVTWVHVTVPLTVTQTGLKGWLKNALGKGAWGERENVRRHQFNELLRARFAGKEPIFDLAQVESTTPDGKPHGFERDGRIYPSLVPAYSYDGEHLNETGRKRAAAALVQLLASIP